MTQFRPMTQFRWSRALAFIAAVGLLAMGGAKPATATTLVGTIDGNDCPGEFGTPFGNCTKNGSPIIVKFEFPDSPGPGTVDPSAVEINSSIFPSIDGAEFDFVFDDLEGTTGTWTYAPGAGDPGITAWVAKAGNKFNLFTDSGLTKGTWETPDDKGLSHLSFYDTDGRPPTEVPSPLTLVLVGAGLLGSVVAGRLKALVG